MKRPTVAVLYLCTGVYQVFWKDFYPNFKELFLPETDKTFFVFTDAPTIDYEGEPDVRRIPQKALPWPYSTMQRFEAILGQAQALDKFDYLFFTNANLHCMAPVHAADLLPDADKGQDLVAVCHLPYYGHNPIFHPYERRRKSRAGIPYNCGQYYVAGGLNGGTAGAYLAMCRELQARTQEDLKNGVIACCHDESQLNRLVVEYSERFRVVGPEFCVPEERPLPPGQERIRVLRKKRFIDVDAVKGQAKSQNFLQRKWEAFNLNWMPYVWYARDKLLRCRADPSGRL